MNNAGYIGLSRQMTLRREMDLIANNLANMSTPAYRSESMLFVEHLQSGRPHHSDDISFVQDRGLVRNLNEGQMTQTGNPLDLAISGEGYFAVETPEGPRYTRDGGFQLDGEGRITTASGHPLLDVNGAPIRIPANSGAITVAGDGSISTELGPLTRLGLVTFQRQQELLKMQEGLYDAGEQEPQAAEGASLVQGMIEGSNVIGVLEISRMIETVRSYASAAKLVNEEHERQRRAVQILGGGQG